MLVVLIVLILSPVDRTALVCAKLLVCVKLLVSGLVRIRERPYRSARA